MPYGELGRFPIAVTIKKRIISFCLKLLQDKASKLSHRLYSVLYNNSVLTTNMTSHGYKM